MRMCAVSCRIVCTTTKIPRIKFHKEDPSGVIKDVRSMFLARLYVTST
jgi:hypothetical protein